MHIRLNIALLLPFIAACPGNEGDTAATASGSGTTTTTGSTTDETTTDVPTTTEPPTTGTATGTTTTTGTTTEDTTTDTTTGGPGGAGARVLYFLGGPNVGQNATLRLVDDTSPDGPAAPVTLLVPPNAGLFGSFNISPGGELMALSARDVDLRAYLFLIDLATLDITEAMLPDDLGVIGEVHFSPDQQMLAFRAGVQGGPLELYLCELTPDQTCTAEVWSPVPAVGASGLSENIAFSDDGVRIAYGGDLTNVGGQQLWLGSTTAPGEAVELAAFDPIFADFGGMRFATSGDVLYYGVDKQTNALYEQFAVDVATDPPGAPVQLSPPVVTDARGRNAPDRSALLWWTGANLRGDLAWIPIDGTDAGPAVTINSDGPGRVNLGRWAWSDDSKRVAYLSDHMHMGSDEISVVDCSGPTPSDPVRVNGPLPPDGTVRAMFITDDSQHIVYFAAPSAAGSEMFLVDLASPGEAVKISGPLVADGTIDETYVLSSDQSTIVYQGTQDDPEVRGLYVVDLSGPQPGAPVQVNPPIPPGAQLFAFSPSFSDDGQRLYFRAPEAVDQHALFRVGASGTPAAVQLSESGEKVTGMIVLKPGG